MFALESLRHAGLTYENNEQVRRACAFLIGKQQADGGWGESYKVRRRHTNAVVRDRHVYACA